MHVYGYIGHHLSSGGGHTNTVVASSELAFLRQLDHWNRIGAGKWLYHSDPHHVVRPATYTETKEPTAIP